MTDFLSRIARAPAGSVALQIETKDHEEPLVPAPEASSIAETIHEEPVSIENSQAVGHEDKAPAEVRSPKTSLWFFGILLISQIGLSILASLNQAALPADIVRNVTLVCGGWALLLGLLVAACAFLRIELSARVALQILSWAAVPIILRSAGALVIGRVPSLSILHAAFDPAYLPTLVFWLRPLDIFEVAAVVILGLSIRQRLGSSILKSLLAAAFIALAWSLAGRGYFQPF